MTFSTKNLLLGGGAVLALLGIRHAVRTSEAGNELRVGLDFLRIHKFKLSGVLLRASIRLKNPTAGTITLKRPFVEVLFRGSIIGSSTAVANDDKITVPPGEMTFDLWPKLSFLQMGSQLIQAFRDAQSGQPLRVGARITTRVNDVVPVVETVEVDVL